MKIRPTNQVNISHETLNNHKQEEVNKLNDVKSEVSTECTWNSVEELKCFHTVEHVFSEMEDACEDEFLIFELTDFDRAMDQIDQYELEEPKNRDEKRLKDKQKQLLCEYLKSKKDILKSAIIKCSHSESCTKEVELNLKKSSNRINNRINKIC